MSMAMAGSRAARRSFPWRSRASTFLDLNLVQGFAECAWMVQRAHCVQTGFVPTAGIHLLLPFNSSALPSAPGVGRTPSLSFVEVLGSLVTSKLYLQCLLNQHVSSWRPKHRPRLGAGRASAESTSRGRPSCTVSDVPRLASSKWSVRPKSSLDRADQTAGSPHSKHRRGAPWCPDGG